MNGEKLRSALSRVDMTQGELAELMGVSSNTVWRWAAGKVEPSDKTKKKIASLLNCSIAYFMDETDDPAPLRQQKRAESAFSGKRLKNLREHRRKTQQELAKTAGVSVDTVGRWEADTSAPNTDKLALIQEFLETSYDYLMGKTDTPLLLDKAPLPRQSARLDTSHKISVPVISAQTPACAGNGNGIEAAIAEAEDFIDVDRYALPILDDLRRPFAIYVDGDSMEEMNIPDGSMAVINPAEDVRDGECALVCYKGLWSIKGIRWNKDGSVSLLAGKPQYNMVIPHEETEDDLWFSILGKVVGVHRWEQPRRFF